MQKEKISLIDSYNSETIDDFLQKIYEIPGINALKINKNSINLK